MEKNLLQRAGPLEYYMGGAGKKVQGGGRKL